MQNRKIMYGITNIRVMLATVFLLLCFLVGLLFCEYRFFCIEAQKMLALQAQYRSYVRYAQKKKLNALNAADTEAEREDQTSPLSAVGEGFIVVNRDPAYLKDSMIDYLKERKLDEAVEHINAQEWQDYTEQSISSSKASVQSPKKNKKARAPRKKKRRAAPATPAPKKKRQHEHQEASLFRWPIEGDNFWLSSLFGPRRKPNGVWGRHTGIDMAAVKGTPVKAAAAGVVSEAGYVSGYGNTIVLRHDNRYKTRYAHLNKIYVKVGQEVAAGRQIGSVGDTGFIRKKGKDGSHLHFEVYSYNKHINPLSVLPTLT